MAEQSAADLPRASTFTFKLLSRQTCLSWAGPSRARSGGRSTVPLNVRCNLICCCYATCAHARSLPTRSQLTRTEHCPRPRSTQGMRMPTHGSHPRMTHTYAARASHPTVIGVATNTPGPPSALRAEHCRAL
eukprot:7630173-Alexandrium_andersonii.AAC.1